MHLLNNSNNCKLYVSQIIDNLHDLAQFLHADTETIVNQIQRKYKSKHRQDEQLTIKAMLSQAIGQDAELMHTQEGRPVLKGSDICISISHSKTHAALMLCQSPNIGVDIEKINDRILRLQSRIVKPGELIKDFDSLNIEDKSTYLTAVWTIKEAVYKSIAKQEGFDLLLDIEIMPANLHQLPAEVQIFIKDIPGSYTAYCQEYEGNVLTYIIR